jgi:hypothetical protein
VIFDARFVILRANYCVQMCGGIIRFYVGVLQAIRQPFSAQTKWLTYIMQTVITEHN